MARIPVYQQQTKQVSVAQPEGLALQSTGLHSRVAKAEQQLGNTLLNIGTNIKNRSDTIDRVRQTNAFDQEAVTQLERMSTEQDITDPRTTEAYRQSMQDLVEKTIEAHSGGSASRAQLRASLEAKMGQYQMSAMQNQIKAQHQLMATTVDKSINSLSAQTSMSPDTMVSNLVEFENQMDELSGALSQSEEDNYRQVGRNKIVTGAINGLLQKGDWQSAKNLMDDENVIQFLTPESSRQISGQIIAEERKAEVAQETMNNNVAKMTMMLKRNLTPEEMMRVQMFPSDLNDMDVSDKIAMVEFMQGAPANSSQINDIMKLTGTFGKGVEGRSMNIIDEDALAYANGLLSPERARRFQMAVQEVYGPKERQNPVTGLYEKTRQTIPPGVAEVIARGSSRYGAPSVEGVDQTGLDPIERSAQEAQAAPGEGRTVWERRSNVTGPVPKAMSFLGRVPGTKGGGQYSTDQQYVAALTTELVRALSQKGGRYLASELETIKQEVSIGGGVFDNPNDYARRLIGIDEAMSDRIESAKADMGNPNISLDLRKQAGDVVSTLTNFRATLGVPPKVKSADEARKLPPGSEFMTPDGRILRVPQNEGVR